MLYWSSVSAHDGSGQIERMREDGTDKEVLSTGHGDITGLYLHTQGGTTNWETGKRGGSGGWEDGRMGVWHQLNTITSTFQRGVYKNRSKQL
jgi:hypothetical protein